MKDVLVVGAGVAGVSATLAAVSAGASVITIDAGAGASCMAGGTWDIACPPCRSAVEVLTEDAPLSERYLHLVASSPDHPYASLGLSLSDVIDAHGALFSALDLYELPSPSSQAALVATSLGALRLSDRIQQGLLDLRTIEGKVGVLDLPSSLEDGQAFCRALLGEESSLGEPKRTYELIACPSDSRPLPVLLRDKAYLKSVCAAAASAISASSLSAVLVPALPMPSTLVSELRQQTGQPIGEVYAPLGNAQSLRLRFALQTALQGALASSLCSVERSRVLRITEAQHSVTVQTEAGELSAKSVVLATGKFVGGGLSFTGGKVLEPLASLRVGGAMSEAKTPGSIMGDDPALLFGKRLAEGGEGHRYGVRHDASLRPRHEDGSASKRIFIAGALLPGHDPLRDGSGMSVACATGSIAGRLAAGV